MKIFNTGVIQSIDKYTIGNEPIASIDLMERATESLFKVFRKNFPNPENVKVFAGPGNNGGDALALARMLWENDYHTDVFLLSSKLSPDSKENLERLKDLDGLEIHKIEGEKNLPNIKTTDIVVDGIFGSGLSRKAEGLYAEVISHMNQSGANVFSIDIPSGLFGEDNRENDAENIVQSALTVSFQFPKLAFMFAENAKFVGMWKVTNIGLHPKIIEKTQTPYYYITKRDIREILKQRKKFSHKGTFGHGLLIAGSYGKMGAAVLSSKAALKAGMGLLTVQVPHVGYPILQTAVPEAMVTIDRSDYLITEFPRLDAFDAIAVGPGLGIKSNTKEMLNNLLLEYDKPMVIDADAINILGEEKEWLNLVPENSILTPHPKEFERITKPASGSYERHLNQIEFAQKYNVIVVLKGACTSVVTPDGICCFNSTGNPGMATAGSGDVLTGIILGLLTQHYTPTEAAVLGVWLHGKAGDLYARNNALESLTASDILDKMGKAFHSLYNR